LARLKTAADDTCLHSVAVCALMVALARQLGLPDELARTAGFAGLLHDVGKIEQDRYSAGDPQQAWQAYGRRICHRACAPRPWLAAAA